MNAVVSTGGGGHRSVAAWWRGRYGFRMLLEIALCAALLERESLERDELAALLGTTPRPSEGLEIDATH